jgi:hypothetical protein
MRTRRLARSSLEVASHWVAASTELSTTIRFNEEARLEDGYSERARNFIRALNQYSEQRTVELVAFLRKRGLKRVNRKSLSHLPCKAAALIGAPPRALLSLTLLRLMRRRVKDRSSRLSRVSHILGDQAVEPYIIRPKV